MLDLFMKTEGELRFASTPRIGLESAALHACEENRGEDASALLERIGELEAKLSSLESAIASGAVAVTVKPSDNEATVRKSTSKPVDAQPAKPELPPAPSDEKAIWDKTLDELKKTDPPVFALLKKERFLGANGNVYQVLIPYAKKEFSYVRLNQQARKEAIGKVLSAVSGQKLLFEAVLESDVGDRKMDAARSDAQQALIDTFGRENVQIDERKEL